ncbi:MAG: tyrosine-type recombinase/integrase [Calditrichia bacterium]
MPSLHKRKSHKGKTSWYIRYRKGNKQKHKTIGYCDKRTAEQIFHKFCSDRARETHGLDEIKKISLEKFVRKYLPAAKVEKADRTVERERQVLQYLMDYFGDVHLTHIEINDLETFRRERLKSVCEVTVNLEFRHLKAIFNKAKKLGYLWVNPFTEIKPLRTPENELPRFFEVDEIKNIREHFQGDEFEQLVEFYILTGARLKEALFLTWDDVDFKRKQIVIRSANAKGKKNRIISFRNDRSLFKLMKSVERRKDGLVFGPPGNRPQWSSSWVCRRISHQLSLLGYEWASAHTFRHTYISHLIMQGVPLRTVQELVGHGDYATTLKYAHLAPNHKDEMIDRRPY